MNVNILCVVFHGVSSDDLAQRTVAAAEMVFTAGGFWFFWPVKRTGKEDNGRSELHGAKRTAKYGDERSEWEGKSEGLPPAFTK